MTVRIRPDIADIPDYRPGKSAPGAIKLASNEVTFGPLPSVAAAIADAATTANRYPDNGAVDLTAALSSQLGLPTDQVYVGCGSVVILNSLAALTSAPGDEIVYAWRSFEHYPIATQLSGATPVTVPLAPGQVHDLAALAAAVTDRTRLVLVCNPNNPTGTVVTNDELRNFLRQVPPTVAVALDEAYYEYYRAPDDERIDAVALTREFPNLVVLRTFSKAYGLAALRVGYAFGSPDIIAGLRRVHPPFSVSTVAQAAARASLAARDELLERTEKVVANRDAARETLQQLGFDVPPSQANFLWLVTNEAEDFARHCAERNIIVRAFAGDGVRVTVTDTAETAAFLDVARDYRQQV